MITLTEITNRADVDYQTIETLYLESFPAQERLPFEVLHLGARPSGIYYKLEKVMIDDRCVGLMSSVESSSFILLFYIATLPTVRGGGIGVQLLEALKLRCSTERPLIAEVEYVTDDITRRRVGFYERNDLTIQPYNYTMPDQTNPNQSVALHIMAWPTELTPSQFEAINESLLHQVYQYEPTL